MRGGGVSVCLSGGRLESTMSALNINDRLVDDAGSGGFRVPPGMFNSPWEEDPCRGNWWRFCWPWRV